MIGAIHDVGMCECTEHTWWSTHQHTGDNASHSILVVVVAATWDALKHKVLTPFNNLPRPIPFFNDSPPHKGIVVRVWHTHNTRSFCRGHHHWVVCSAKWCIQPVMVWGGGDDEQMLTVVHTGQQSTQTTPNYIPALLPYIHALELVLQLISVLLCNVLCTAICNPPNSKPPCILFQTRHVPKLLDISHLA